MKILRCPIYLRARSHPHHIAIETEDRSYTFLEFEKLIEQACYFLNQYMTRKDLKIFLLKASLEINTLALFFASLRLALVPCLLYSKGSQEDICNIKKELRTSLFIDPSQVNFSHNFLCKDRVFFSNNLILFLMTSGSSGKPKYVGLSLHNFYYSFKGIYKKIGLSSSSRYLLNLPLNHVSGLSIVFRALFCGATLVLKKPTETFSSFLVKEKISHLSVVSLQLRRWMNESAVSTYHHLKCVLLGGGPTAEALITQSLKQNIPLFQSYGMTESSSAITCKKLKIKSLYTCGKPLLYRTIILKKKQIFLSGKTLCLGYLNTTSMKIIPQKLLKTKDIGVYNKRELIVLGRKDNMLILKGENIYPENIEQTLQTHLEIEKACLVAVTSSKADMELVAFVKTKYNKIPDDIFEFSKNYLSSIKRPKRFFLWPLEVDSGASKISKSQRKTFHELALSKILESS